MGKLDGRAVCRICVSPYRDEIDTALQGDKVNKSDIARKYAPLFETSEKNFYQSLTRHIDKKHSKSNVVVLSPNGAVKMATVESFAQKLLEIGDTMANESPEKVSMKDVIAAQRLVIEKAKLKMGETELMLKVAEIFGGISDPKSVESEDNGGLLGTSKK